MTKPTSFLRLAMLPIAMTVAVPACGNDRSKGSMVQLSENEKALLSRLEAAESTGRLEDLELEYWIGGGAPPPYHRSDQLRFRVVDGSPVVELNVATFDEKHPELATIKYRAPLQGDELRAVAKLVRETGAFSSKFPEEEKPDVADILRTELTLSSANRTQSAKRVYYKAPPGALAPLAERLKLVVARVVKEGDKRCFDRDRKEMSCSP